MIKVLLTSLAVPSHLWTMVIPTARALAAAGHEVTVATAAPMADPAVTGVPMLPLRRMLTQEQLAADPELAAQAGFGGQGTLADDPDATPGSRFGRFMAGVLAARAAAELIEVAAPDLVIRESLDFSGALLAEKIGVPLVTLDNAPLELLARDPALLPWLNRSRAALGIRTSDALPTGPWITWIAPGWLPAESAPADYRSYQAPPDPAPEPVAKSGEPLVLVAFGSLLRHTVGVDGSPLARVVEALGTLPCTAVVALGDDDAVASWTGPRPANVQLTGFVAQRALLPRCDLFITHAGFGSLRESLTAGVPMLALPLHSEQPANARRLADLGVARTLDPATASPAEIASAARTLLTDPAYRAAAGDWQRRITALPDTSAMIHDLEALVRPAAI
jgi:hypothetical protein